MRVVGLVDLVWPRRIGDDDGVWAGGRIWWWLGANGSRLLDHAESLERPINAPGAVHIFCKFSEACRVSLRCIANRASLGDGRPTDSDRLRDAVEGPARTCG